jgi:hypothetical protein
LICELPCPAHDGRTAVPLSPLELLDRLARLIPPPQTELLGLDPPSPRDRSIHAPSGRDPFDQSLPGDDGTWSA